MGLLDDAIREHLELRRRRGADPTEISRLEREALGPVRNRGDQAQDVDENLELGPTPEVGAVADNEDLAFADEQTAAPGAAPAVGHETPEHPTEFLAPPARPPGDADETARPGSPLIPEPHPSAEQTSPLAPEPPAPERAAPVPVAPRQDAPPPAPAPSPAPAGEPTVQYDVRTGGERESDAQPHTSAAPTNHPAGADAPLHPQPPALPPSPDTASSPSPTPDEREARTEDVLEETPDFLQETPEHDRLWFEQRPPRDFDFDK